MYSKQVVPALGFLGVIYTSSLSGEDLFRKLTDRFGPLGLHSPEFPFDDTAYYHAEMGEGLSRVFFELPGLVEPDFLLHVKAKARELEKVLSFHGRRSVNIDPGYLDSFKVVLLSDKYSGRKVYLGQRCYADVTLTFSRGAWQADERAFPDFRSGRYFVYFMKLRERYLANLRNWRSV